MTHEPFRPVIRSQADLSAAWDHLMGPFGYDHHAIWWMFIHSDGRAIPHLAEITDTDRPPALEEREPFAGFLADLALDLALPDVRIAFLITRPGSGVVQRADRCWAEALYDVTRRAGLGRETVHLGVEAGIVPIPLDELGDFSRLGAAS